MDLTTIEAIKNITVSALFTTPVSEINQKIYVPFTPDYVVIKGINYYPDIANGDVGGNYLVYSDLVSDYIGSIILNTITDDVVFVANPQVLMFKLAKPVTSDFRFQFQQNGQLPVLMGGSVSIHLEFIKLKAEKPQVVR